MLRRRKGRCHRVGLWKTTLAERRDEWGSLRARHTDFRTTMNLYGDVVTDEMVQAHSKLAGLAVSRSD